MTTLEEWRDGIHRLDTMTDTTERLREAARNAADWMEAEGSHPRPDPRPAMLRQADLLRAALAEAAPDRDPAFVQEARNHRHLLETFVKACETRSPESAVSHILRFSRAAIEDIDGLVASRGYAEAAPDLLAAVEQTEPLPEDAPLASVIANARHWYEEGWTDRGDAIRLTLDDRSVSEPASPAEADPHPGEVAWTRGHGQGDWCRVHGVIPSNVSVKQHILDQHPDIDYEKHLERAIANDGDAESRVTSREAGLDAERYRLLDRVAETGRALNAYATWSALNRPETGPFRDALRDLILYDERARDASKPASPAEADR